MSTKRVNISLPTQTLEKLKAVIPEGKRSGFINKALEEKLKGKSSLRESIVKDLKENKWIHEQVTKDWSSLEVEGWPE